VKLMSVALCKPTDDNCMQNGTVIIPEVLQPYMDNQKVISKLSTPINIRFSSLKKEQRSEKGLSDVHKLRCLLTLENYNHWFTSL